MRKIGWLLPLALAGLLAACDEGGEAQQSEELRWTEQQQVHSENDAATQPRPAATPEEQAQQFFQALRNQDIEQAAAMVSSKSLQASGADVTESLRQWLSGQGAAQQQFEVIDSEQRGDFALVRTRMMAPQGGAQSGPLIRPVILFREEGQWKVVWDLLGMEPERVAEADPQTAAQLEPLYDWYTQQQRTETGEPQLGEQRTGGSPATDQALRRQGLTEGQPAQQQTQPAPQGEASQQAQPAPQGQPKS